MSECGVGVCVSTVKVSVPHHMHQPTLFSADFFFVAESSLSIMTIFWPILAQIF